MFLFVIFLSQVIKKVEALEGVLYAVQVIIAGYVFIVFKHVWTRFKYYYERC